VVSLRFLQTYLFLCFTSTVVIWADVDEPWPVYDIDSSLKWMQPSSTHPQTSSLPNSIPQGRKRLFFHVSPVFRVFPLLAPSCFPPSINPTETTEEKKERKRMKRREITNDDLPWHGTTQVAISATLSISLMNLSDLMTPKHTLPSCRQM